MNNQTNNNTNTNPPTAQKKSCECAQSTTSLPATQGEFKTLEARKKCCLPQSLNQMCNVIKQYDHDLYGKGDTVHVNMQLNEVFMRRIHDIDTMAGNNLALKVVTYQEWVDTLLYVNENLISCIVELESGIASRVAEAQQVVSIPSQSSTLSGNFDQLSMLQRDIDRMKTLVRCGYYYKSWDADHLKFETMTRDDIFKEDDPLGRTSGGMQPNYEHLATAVRFNPVDQMNKIDVNVKALAFEVANKHDEIRDLKKQINSLEEEIQNAQKKIQLKDNVIKELRTDRKSNVIKSPTQVSKSSKMSTSDKDEIQDFEFLPNFSNISEENMALFERDFEELCSATTLEKRELHRRHLNGIMRGLINDKIDAQRKFNNLCAVLADIEKDCSLTDKDTYEDFEEKFGNRGDFDHSTKLVSALRERLMDFHKYAFDLRKNMQLIKIENSEINNKFLAQKAMNDRNSEVLRQVADLLSKLTNASFTYDNIYNPQFNKSLNPFCECILSMTQNFGSREKNVQDNIENLKEKVSSLQEIINRNERSTKIINDSENHDLKCQIDDYKAMLLQKDQKISELTILLNDTSTHIETARGVKDLRRKTRKQLDDALAKSAELQRDVDRFKEDRDRLSVENMQLRSELKEQQKKNAELVSRVGYIKVLMEKHEKYGVDMGQKYTRLETSYEVVKGQLHSSDNNLMALQKNYEDLQTRHNETEATRQKQCEELFQLKQQIGAFLGKTKSMERLLSHSVKEIEALKLKCSTQQSDLREKEQFYKDGENRSKDFISELQKKLEKLAAENKEMEAAYKEEKRIRMMLESMKDSYTNWKEEQLSKDKEFKMLLTYNADHIEQLIRQIKKFQENYRSLHTENDSLKRELDRFIQESRSHSSFTEYPMFAERLESIKATSEKIRKLSCKVPEREQNVDIDNTTLLT